MVVTEGLGKQYGSLRAVQDVTLTVAQGSIFGIVGTNGAGKSTFLSMLLGLTRPSEGRARVLGSDVTERSGAYRERVGFVTDQDYFLRQFSVREMIAWGRKTWSRWDDIRCRQLLESFELPANRPVRSLSKGMRVQLAFVSALSLRPEVLILDEATSGLDAVVKRQILQLIVQEAASGVTVIMATHNLAELERIAERVAFFHEGRVVLQTSTEDAKREMRRIQVVFPGGLPEAVRMAPGVLRVEESGAVYNVIVETEADKVAELCRQHGPIYMEELEVDFEELFVHIMHKEGYAREEIVLA